MDQQYIRMNIEDLCKLLALNTSLMTELISTPTVNLRLLEESVSYQFKLHEKLRSFLVLYDGASDEMMQKYDELLHQMQLQAILFSAKIGMSKSA